jgi:hypothetical protein
MRQVVQFLELDNEMISGKENYQFRNFMDKILQEFKINILICDLII